MNECNRVESCPQRGAKIHDRYNHTPDSRQERCATPNASHGVGYMQTRADLSGATLARRPMGPGEQLAQGRGRDREGGGGEGVRPCAQRSRPARAVARARPHIRRSQAAQRNAVLCGRIAGIHGRSAHGAYARSAAQCGTLSRHAPMLRVSLTFIQAAAAARQYESAPTKQALHCRGGVARARRDPVETA